MGGMFSAPSMPAPPPPPPPPPTTDSAAVEEAARNERRARAASTGRASTILTGGTGDAADATTAKAVLLGQ
jgi:hypothetical protein